MAIANDGNVHVHSNAILHTNGLTGNGAAVNEGKLSLDEKDGTGPTFDVAGSFTNKGENSVLDASKVEKVTVSGTQSTKAKPTTRICLLLKAIFDQQRNRTGQHPDG